VERSGRLPLSLAQRRLWFLLRLDESAGLAYHVSAAVRLTGKLNRASLRAALNRIVERHESLRTTFDTADGEPLQMIAPAREAGLTLIEQDLRASAQPEQALRGCFEQEAREPFDLQRGPLVRGRLIRTAAQEHALLISAHHLISDGWSMGVLMEELSALYAAFVDGRPDPLPPLPIQYGDYAQWHRRWLTPQRLQPQAEYWQRALAGAPQRLELPCDRAPPAAQSYDGAGLEVVLDEALVRDVRALAARHGTTLFVALLASWAGVLSRLSGQQEVLIGTVIANRPRLEHEQLIGHFVNTQAIRVDLADAPASPELLRRVRERVISALSHADIPFERVVERARPARTLAHSPVFQTMLAWRPAWRLHLPGLQVEPMMTAAVGAQFDLTLSLGEVGERVVGAAVYATALFEESTVARYIAYWKVLLRALAADEHCPVERIALLSESEKRQLASWNTTQVGYPAERCIHELFEEQVAHTPDAVALVCAGERLTYAQLNARANQLAHYLMERGVGPDVPVAICAERSVAMVLGLLGILKAGGAYVPLDPTYPRERLRYMLCDSGPALLLLQAGGRIALAEPLTVPSVDLEADAAQWRGHSSANPRPADLGLRPDHLAYIIYTSGSTGQPKGVMNEHRAVVNRLHWMQREYALNATDRVLQKTPFSFDVSVWELFWPLLNGAGLVMARPEGHKDPYYVGELIEQERISVVHFVPSMLQGFLACGAAARCASLRYVICSGEELTTGLQSRALTSLPQASLQNLYGPTEAAIDVTWWPCREQPAGTRVPIGRPIANTRIYILDRHAEPVPIGAAGEIYIGGTAVARGYWRRARLTAERFVSDPFSGLNGARMYRTGDRGRWRSDGTIEYLGRTDGQVKIHGFRIELGEIETTLRRQPGVSQAAVVAREDQPGAKRLVAYLSGGEAQHVPTAGELRAALQKSLPAYMVPAAYVQLPALPLTVNGKLDRGALPAPTAEALEHAEYEPPRGPIEQALAAMWQQLLRVGRVGRQDNFFALGGHSMLALSLVERMRRRGMRADLRALFTHANLAALADAVSTGEQESDAPLTGIPSGCQRITPQMLPLVTLEPEHIECIVHSVPGGTANIQDIYPLAPLQEGILFHHLLSGPGRDAYVRPILYELSTRERLEELLAALQAIVDRHDILRTAILWEGLPRAVQVVCRRASLPVESLTLDPERDAVEQLEESMMPRRLQLDLRRPPLIKVQTAAAPDAARWYAIVCTHHLVCDNESINVLFDELAAHLEGRAEAIPQPTPYRDHVAQTLEQARSRDAQAFFRGKIGDVDQPTAPFGLMDVRGDGTGIHGAHEELQADLGNRLRRQARHLRVTAATLFHAAWALAVAKTGGREDVVFGTVLAGRLHGRAAAQRVLGMFINTLPLRLPLQGATTKELVERTHRELAELLGHEQASLAEAQRCSAVGEAAPLFTSLLNYRHAGAKDPGSACAPGVALLAMHGRTNYPVLLSVDERDDGFGLDMETDRRIDPRRMLGYVCAALQSLVAALERSPDKPALSLDVLPDAERRQVTEGFNPVQRYPQERLLQELFEEQVRLHPRAIAVSCAGKSLTYAELNARANQLAWHLRGRGVGAERLVAICMERGVEMVVGLLGILKAGGAYVPLDPSYPAERLAYMLGDAAPPVVVTQERLKRQLPQSAATVVSVDTDREAIRRQPTRDPEPRAQGLRGDSLAYVIYTSGSTGNPKGVMVEHRNVLRLFAATESWFGFGAQDVWTLFHSFAFDFSVWELWGALLYGGRVVIVPQLMARSPQEFYRLLCQEGVTVLSQTPSAFAQLARAQGECPDLQHALRAVIFGGEALEPRALRPWVRRNGAARPRLINMYGITETTVHVTYRQLAREEIESERASVIGRPIPDLRAYLLDGHRQPVPVEVAGEIYVGGAGVARGYLNRPELTAERFVPDPFSAEPGARMYKTGDVGKWRPDGTIEYLGRNDEQVKIRGFRIELGEIEAQLVRHETVEDAVVLAREDEPGEKRLVAYVIAKEGEAAAPCAESLREHLTGILPEYMVPSAYVMLESFPLTAHGKLDRRALPAPNQSAYTRRAYEPPRGAVEDILASIWQELLDVERVGRRDNFFALGGHSLLAVSLIERMRRRGMRADLGALFTHADLAQLAEAVVTEQEPAAPQSGIPEGCERITPEMLPLIALEQWQIDEVAAAVPGGAPNIQDIYPLAPLQQGILFHHLMQERGDPYVVSSLLALQTGQQLRDFRSALQAVIDRHDILRTGLAFEGLPEPVQVVWRNAPLGVRTATLHSQDGPRELWERFDPRSHRLDVRRAPLVEAIEAYDAPQDRWLLLLLFHHLAIDHTSLEIIFEEVHAHLEGRQRELPTPVPFRTFVTEALRTIPAHEHEAFFTAMLGGIEEPTAPFGLLDVQGDGSGILEASRELDASLAREVRACARRHAVSAASLHHLAWAQVLARLTGLQEVVFGTVLFGRMQAGQGADRALGMLINTLPIRVSVGEAGAREAVNATHGRLIQLLRHEHASLVTAQRCSGVAPPAPLFTSVLNYRHSQIPPFEQVNGPAFTAVQVLRAEERSNYPIILSVDDLGEGFRLVAQVHAALDPQRLCEFMHQALAGLVQALSERPETPIRAIDVLPASERRRLQSWNATAASYPQELCIHQLFEEQAARTPAAVALVCEGQRLTYAQLNASSNRLAHFLRERGVGPDARVALCAVPSLERVVGLLAILKAGGAYVPLDPSYPRERLRYMLEDSAPALVLLQEGTRTALGEAIAMPAIDLERDALLWRGHPSGNPSAAAVGLRPDHLAYIIYTSGSTGQPKGVMNEHRGMVNRIAAQRRFEGFCERDVCCHKTSISFVDAVFEIFGPLCSGSCLVVIREVRDPAQIAATVAREQITHLLTVPTLARCMLADPELVRQLAGLRIWTLSGEEISGELLTALHRQLPDCEFIMQYGASEVSSDAALYKSRHFAEERVPIGPPMANVQMHVLDAQGAPAPIGVAGEIWVGGVGVARGYLNRPDLTAERFVHDRFAGGPHGRLYRTGDLGRWRSDGMLECLGRCDSQVKIRGFRIELGEVETELRRLPAVAAAVVLAREDEPGEKRLVAYVVGRQGEEVDARILREQLLRRLPEHMIPAAYVRLEALPLTANGKLDRRALPTPDSGAYAARAYEPPHGGLEELLAAIWQELLKVERVGRGDNFFALGGHSLLATRVMARVRDALGVELPLRTVFEAPSLLELAARVEQLAHERGGIRPMPLAPQKRTVQLPLSHAQERLWFMEQLGLTGCAYNLSLWLHLDGELDVVALRRSFVQLVERQESLRTRFEMHCGVPVQVIESAAAFELAVRDIGVEELRPLMRNEGQRRFVLSEGAPFRAVLAKLDTHEHVLLLTMHHIIADGWSLGIFARELRALYAANIRDQAPALAPLPVQYADYALWQRSHLQGEQLHEQLIYWRERLLGLAPLQLPADHPRPRTPTFKGAVERFEVSPEVFSGLTSLARSERATLFMVLLGAFQVLLGRYSRQSDVVVGTAIAGRTQRASEALIGCFVNVLALRTDLSGDPSFMEVLGRVREVTLGAYAHQDLPFETLVAELQPQRDLSRQPLYQVSFTFQNVPREPVELPGLQCRLLPMEHVTSKLDLSLSMHESGGVLRGELEYATDLFEASSIQRMVEHFERVLEQLAAQPCMRIGEVQLLTAAERRQLLEEWNATTTDYPQERCIHELFEEQVQRTPGAVALECEGKKLTYRELDEQAGSLARHLIEWGVGPEVIVGLFLERGPLAIVGILAILKAGGAYLPLDPAYPAQRLQVLLEQVAVPILLTRSDLEASLPLHQAQVAYLDRPWDAAGVVSPPGSGRRARPAGSACAQNLACVMYTSGSTGVPKAIGTLHQNIVRLVRNTNYISPDSRDVFLQLAPLSFDASTFEIWGALLNGARIVLYPNRPVDLGEVAEYIQRHRITVLWLTAGLFHQLAERPALSGRLRSLRALLAGGEALSAPHVRTSMRVLPGCRLINGYGPTEATTFSACALLDDPQALQASVPIGRAISNTRLYVLDEHLNPMPVGMVGELYIGGAGLARGYLGRPGLTAQCFIANPFGGGDRLYRTGDLVRYRADGSLEFIGRSDGQVKLRGHRIEPAEIELLLQKQPEVAQAVVTLRGDTTSDKRLVAYVVCRESRAAPERSELVAQLRSALRKQLPEYMVPAAFVLLETLPLTSRGKVDRCALPEPDVAEPRRNHVPARTPLEREMAEIWREVLKADHIGVEDNFFDLGGHSLRAVAMIALVRERLAVNVLLTELFENPTIAGLCAQPAFAAHADDVMSAEALEYEEGVLL